MRPRVYRYAQKDPLREYQEQGLRLFQELVTNIQNDTTSFILRAQVRQNTEREQVMKAQGTNRGEVEQKKKPKTNMGVVKVGRNDPCPCGSGKKYKYCHGK